MTPRALLPTLALALLLGGSSPAAADPASGALVVRIDNLQNVGEGRLVVQVLPRVKRVEPHAATPVQSAAVDVDAASAEVRFADLAHAEYAVVVFHDMDGDGRAGTNFIGFPNEDLAVSNNAKGGPLGGPKWAEARFEHRAAETRLQVTMWQCRK